MPDSKRPKPADEDTITTRGGPENLAETVIAPGVPRRQTLALGVVRSVAAVSANSSDSTNLNESTVPPGVELVVVEEPQVSGGEKRPWRAAEVWTKRRVYGLDSTFKCVEVLDRETGLPERGHEMLGARLGGGRQRDKDNKVRFSYPLPLPGMEAMFMKQKKHGYTSPVERMVVRVRVLVTSAEDKPPSWDEIATRWSEPPSR